MAFDLWFPLAIYHADLEDYSAHRAGIVDRIQQLRHQAGEKRTNGSSSWTGDIHAVDQLHEDPAFAWLTDQVGQHTLTYLAQLGHNMDMIDVHIQRSWPIIARKDEAVALHAHYTAHISAVFYVSVPKDITGGQTRFDNVSRMNELTPGIGAAMTNGYSEVHPLNFQRAHYDPQEGRLLLFPSKTKHDVTAHQQEEDRISISYDLILTARDIQGATAPEFLMPPPSRWKRIARDFDAKS